MSKSRQVEALTLYQLNRRIAELVTNSSTQNVWVTAELSDVAVRGGHCYMELLQKDPDTGATVAKARAAIWANVFSRLRSDFDRATGQEFATGLKVMVRASVSMHPVYGMSLVINAVNPEYTMGDLLRRRKEMLARLKAEGILDMNRSLCWNEPPLRIAIVSAEGAAGYGDFMNQLNGNQLGLRFTTRLFPAIMQGERTAQSVIAALGLIAVEQEQWDGVVIIRGGGATSDLMGFENYDLAAAVAQFPLPVIVGIGHERDVTILDYVANIRVKTPTAAAEWLIEQGAMALDRLDRLGNDIVHAVRERLAGCKIQLGQMEGAIPSVARGMLERSHNKMARYAMALQSVASKRIIPQLSRLEALESTLKLTTANAIERRSTRLDSMNRLLDALSPMSTLKRGYSITRFNGHAVTNEADIPAGARLETTLAEGVMVSIKQ